VAIQTYLDEVCASAARVEAVNTVVRAGDRLLGHNTDLAGFTAALLAMDLTPRAPTILFGAGGAARAVALALFDLGLPPAIVNRTISRAEALAACIPGTEAVHADDPALLDRLKCAGVVIDATSLGLHPGDPSPLPRSARLRPDAVVIDLVYGRDTAFLRQARSFGCRVNDGVEMLVRQGAESFRLWTGIDPDLEVMRAACRQELEVRAC
jgi:shikimate dehydrogenase